MKPSLDKLEVGMEFKSFKELVQFVGLTYRSGGSDIAVLTLKLQKYISWERVTVNGKQKRAIVITDIK